MEGASRCGIRPDAGVRDDGRAAARREARFVMLVEEDRGAALAELARLASLPCLFPQPPPR
jgi:hypothetical protein